jgi:hypothetical protein
MMHCLQLTSVHKLSSGFASRRPYVERILRQLMRTSIRI